MLRAFCPKSQPPRRDWERTQDYVWVGKLTTPGINNVANAATTPTQYARRYERRVNSLYGQAELGYRSFAFLTVTGRNDWSSTLPEAERQRTLGGIGLRAGDLFAVVGSPAAKYYEIDASLAKPARARGKRER